MPIAQVLAAVEQNCPISIDSEKLLGYSKKEKKQKALKFKDRRAMVLLRD